MCEPQLRKRGLYDPIGDKELAMLWTLNLSDGDYSLLDIVERSRIHFTKIHEAASLLCDAGLLKEVSSELSAVSRELMADQNKGC